MPSSSQPWTVNKTNGMHSGGMSVIYDLNTGYNQKERMLG